MNGYDTLSESQVTEKRHALLPSSPSPDGQEFAGLPDLLSPPAKLRRPTFLELFSIKPLEPPFDTSRSQSTRGLEDGQIAVWLSTLTTVSGLNWDVLNLESSELQPPKGLDWTFNQLALTSPRISYVHCAVLVPPHAETIHTIASEDDVFDYLNRQVFGRSLAAALAIATMARPNLFPRDGKQRYDCFPCKHVRFARLGTSGSTLR